MNNINNKANQQIGKHKTTTSSQPNNSIPHTSNSKYDDAATSNKNPNDNFTFVTKQGKRNLSSSSQISSTLSHTRRTMQNIIKKKPNCLNQQIGLKS